MNKPKTQAQQMLITILSRRNQTQVAEYTGIKQGSISQLLNGKQKSTDNEKYTKLVKLYKSTLTDIQKELEDNEM